MITDQHREDLEAYLRDVAEAAGQELDAESFPRLLYQEWDVVVDARNLARRAADREIKKLEQDKIDTEAGLTEINRRLEELKRDPAPIRRSPA